jgi:Transposase DDE domain
MQLANCQPLFAWDALEDSPSLGTLKHLLASIPDGPLLDSLRQARGHGRDDHPVGVLWGVVLLTIALRHVHFEACLAELRRNDDLRALIGIPRDEEEKVPDGWNVSRFLLVLGQEPHRGHLHAVFDHMVQRLGEAVPDLGSNTAGDASALNARRKRKREASATTATTQPSNAASDGTLGHAEVASMPPAATPTATALPAPTAEDQPAPVGPVGQDKVVLDSYGLPVAAGGRKEYTDADGKVVKVVEWFGYKFHLLVDVKHEVTLAYHISSTKMGDNEVLPDLLQQARANLPAGRIKTLAYDKAADDEAVHELLHDAGIQPLIQQRHLWKTEPERLLPGHDGSSNIVYDEAGTLYCYDKVSDPPVRHQMAYIGHEPERGTLKYRCPAKHEDWPCPMSSICNAGKSYGKTVRIKQEEDLRRFPPIPRATKQFERLYKGRTAVERVNGRIKIYWGADDGNIVGGPRFHAFLGAIMVVHLGMATVLASLPRREGTLGKMKLSPIAKALQEEMAKA